MGRVGFCIVWASSLLLIGHSGGATPSAAENPFAPASDQVTARFAIISEEIVRLQGGGFTQQAQVLQEQLTHFQREYLGHSDSSVSGTELDVVACYRGSGATGVGPGPAYVHLGKTDRAVVLGLCSYDVVNWTLSLEPGASLKSIILYSYESGSTCNVPPGVVVQQVKGYIGSDPDFKTLPYGLRSLVSVSGGTPVTSYNGTYNASNAAVVVGPANADWRAQRVLREMQELYDEASAYCKRVQLQPFATARFPGFIRASSNYYPAAQFSSHYAQFSLTSPIWETARKLSFNDLNGIAMTPDGNTAYAIGSSALYQLNPATGQTTELSKPGSALPALSWPCGVTYDTRRNRLILCSLGGEGFVYAYTPQDQQWSLISSLNNNDLNAMVYLPATDCLYGIGNSGEFHNSKGAFKLFKYSMEGQLLTTLDIGAVIPVDYSEIHNVQMQAIGENLVIMTGLAPDLYHLDLPNQQMGFVIDPTDGGLLYSGAIAVPEPPLACSGIFLHFLRRRCRPKKTCP